MCFRTDREGFACNCPPLDHTFDGQRHGALHPPDQKERGIFKALYDPHVLARGQRGKLWRAFFFWDEEN